jgi:hypothetical protein
MVEIYIFAIVGTLFGGLFVFKDGPDHPRKLDPLLAVVLMWLGMAALALIRPVGYQLLALGSLMAICAVCYFRSANRNKEPGAVDSDVDCVPSKGRVNGPLPHSFANRLRFVRLTHS